MVQTSKPILMTSHFIVLFSHGTLNSTICKQIVDPTPVMCQQFLECMKVTDDQVSAVDAATCGQSDSEVWQALRNGRLTSSRFGEILKCRPTTDSCRLVKDIMGYNGLLKKIQYHLRSTEEKKMKQGLVITTLTTDDNMMKIWWSKLVVCTFCQIKVLLELPLMVKYCAETLTPITMAV